jgi:hypothetical protein
MGVRGRRSRKVGSMLRAMLPWLILAALGLGPLFACALIGPASLGGELGLKAAPDWSRALPVGAGLYGTDSGAPLAVDAENKVHLVWAVRPRAEEYDLHYVRLDALGRVEEEHDLNSGLYEPRRMQLLRDDEGLIHVFLLAAPDRGDLSSLFHLVLGGDGRVISGPSLVSSGENPCYSYDLTAGADGVIHLFWVEGKGVDSRLLYSSLSPGLVTVASPELLATGVSNPVAGQGQDGMIHLLWEQPGETEDASKLKYAALTGEVTGPLSGIELLDLPTGTRFFRMGPVMAVDHDYAYLVWTVEYRKELFAPAISEGWYAAFPLESPSSVRARPFSLPMDERPKYAPHDSPYSYGYLVSSDGDTEFGSDRIEGPSVLAAQDEAVVALSVTVMRGLTRENQIANVMFANGAMVGYQLACNTPHWSRLPNLALDANGQLYLSWAEGLEPGPSDVYFASTSPLVRARVDHITSDDVVLALLNTVFSAASAAAMIPFAVLWVIPPLIWLFVCHFFLGGSGVSGRRAYLALSIALLIYLGAKVYFTPALLEYTPFTLSVPFISSSLYLPLRIAVPICSAGLGVAAVIYVLRRSESSSLLASALAFILVDAFLTIVVYGPGLAVMA